MGTFREGVYEIWDVLCETHAFVPDHATSSKEFAALVCFHRQTVYYYLFVRDGRAYSANVDVRIWVAPPHEPGDGIDRLYMGCRIHVADAFDIDDRFFINSQNRIIHLLPYLDSLADAVESEMKAPAFTTDRQVAYRHEREALMCVHAYARKRASSNCRVALDTAAQVASGRKRGRKPIENAAIAAAAEILEDDALDVATLAFYADAPKNLGIAKFLGMSLVGHLYVDALAELSRSRQGQ